MGEYMGKVKVGKETIYQFDRFNIRMVGDYVGLMWPVKRRENYSVDENGKQFAGHTRIIAKRPVIKFCTCSVDGRAVDGAEVFMRDIDEFIGEGLELMTATSILKEFKAAVEITTEIYAKLAEGG